MRIISGKLKGKTISFLKSSTTRPLKDSVKESIFNIIIHSNLLNVNIRNSKILDLYSGIGSFGLECISRGAERITFVEKDKNAAKKALKKAQKKIFGKTKRRGEADRKTGPALLKHLIAGKSGLGTSRSR